MKDRYERIIKDYLVETFGNDKAFPKPVLEGLADALEKHRWEIFNATKQECLMEDIIGIEEDREVELTDDELAIVMRKFEKYDTGNGDLLWDIISDVLSDREREENNE